MQLKCARWLRQILCWSFIRSDDVISLWFFRNSYCWWQTRGRKWIPVGVRCKVIAFLLSQTNFCLNVYAIIILKKVKLVLGSALFVKKYSFMLPSSVSFLIACCVTPIKVPNNDWAFIKASNFIVMLRHCKVRSSLCYTARVTRKL